VTLTNFSKDFCDKYFEKTWFLNGMKSIFLKGEKEAPKTIVPEISSGFNYYNSKD